MSDFTVLIIDRKKGIFLKHHKSSLFLRIKSAGSDHGFASVFKLQPDLRKVDLFCKNPLSCRSDINNFRLNYTRYYINIVDHQIKRNVHICASSRKRRQALRLHKPRLSYHPGGSDNAGVVSFEVSHLKDQISASRLFDEVLPLLQSRGYGFLYKNIFPGLEAVHRYLKMRCRRRDNADRIAVGKQVFII